VEVNELQPVAVALADEGVPIRAIARATKIPSDELRDLLKDAQAHGLILELPREDWPRPMGQKRQPVGVRLTKFAEADLLGAAMRAFELTLCQARIMLTLIRLPGGISRDRMHAAYNRRADGQVETASKILDVQYYKMRKRLQKYGLEIITEWGYGKRLSKDDQLRALKMLLDALSPPPK
jgi:hypothetical protein